VRVMDINELIYKVFQAGVVGAGGAGFPTHVKLKASVDTYLINGAECEPLLDGDKFLMTEKADKLVSAGNEIAEALGGARLLFGLKAKNQEAGSALEEAGAETVKIKDYYPAGDEVILIHEALQRIVPEGKLPLSVGVVVNNVESLYNIYNAIQDIPVTHTFVSVGGAVNVPGLYRVPLGASASDLLKAAGGVSIEDPVFVDGGPMMGTYRKTPDFPLTKISKAVLVLPEKSALVKYETMPLSNMLKQARVACCQCNQCTLACSRNLVGYDLEPHKIMRAMAYGNQQNMEVLKTAMLCSECNLCSGLHACPMQLSPRRVNQEIKRSLREQGVKIDFPERTMEAHPLRDYRLLPGSRLKKRLQLDSYDIHSPFRGDLDVHQVKIPMKQHIGTPCVPVVEKGEKIRSGQIIGMIPEDALGSRIHASIKGVVSSVDPENVVIIKDEE